MRATAAKIVAQRIQRLFLGGMGIALQQRLGGHDHAAQTIAALRGLLTDKGILHRIGIVARAEAFEGYDVASDTARDRDHASPRRHLIDQHGAGAAFAKTAAEFGAVQFKIIAQHVEQGGVRRGANVVDPAVHPEADRGLRHEKIFRSERCAARIEWNLAKDNVCVQTCKPGVRRCRVARFVNTSAGQMS